jgi:hypothetical protein
MIYIRLVDQFGKMHDRIGMGEKEEFVTGRRRITLHSFRRFGMIAISHLGFSDFSEYFLGHAGSTYYREPDH